MRVPRKKDLDFTHTCKSRCLLSFLETGRTGCAESSHGTSGQSWWHKRRGLHHLSVYHVRTCRHLPGTRCTALPAGPEHVSLWAEANTH